MHRSRHSRQEYLFTHVGLLVHTTKIWEAVGTSTRADACACEGDPSQTGETLEKLTHMFGLLGPCSKQGETREKNCTHVTLLGLVVETMKDQKKHGFVCHRLGAWDWWSGRGDTSVGKTHETTDT